MARPGQYETPSSGYSRRLRSILNDPDYGPKLVRLSAADQQRVLRLVDATQGRDARKLINQLDAERRAKNTVRRRALRYARLPEQQRQAERPDETRQFWLAYDRIIIENPVAP